MGHHWHGSNDTQTNTILELSTTVALKMCEIGCHRHSRKHQNHFSNWGSASNPAVEGYDAPQTQSFGEGILCSRSSPINAFEFPDLSAVLSSS